MTDIQRGPGGAPIEPLVSVYRDDSLGGNGTADHPLSLAISVSAQIRITAHIDGDGDKTYTAEVLSITGGVVYGGLDESLIDSIGYLKVILTLTDPIADRNRLAIPGIHYPSLPPGPLGNTVFFAVPPVPLQTEDPLDASLLMPLFGNGIPDTDEIIDITLDLVQVQRS